jgi:hypothetical protein
MELYTIGLIVLVVLVVVGSYYALRPEKLK